MTTSQEEWVAEVSKAGSGIIRTQASGSGATSDAIPGDRTIITLGPVHWATAEMLEGMMSKRMMRLDKKIDALAGKSDFRSAREQMELLRDYHVELLKRDALREGKYLTLPVGTEPPPKPPKHVSYLWTELPLAAGGMGRLYFVFDSAKHEALASLDSAIAEMDSFRRQEEIREFNSQDPETLRRITQQHHESTAKVQTHGMQSLTAVEFTEYWRFTMMLRQLHAELHPGSMFLVEAR